MDLGDVARDHADGGGQYRRVVGKTEDRQHIRHEIERQNEIRNGAEQRRLFEIEGSLGPRTPRFALPSGAFGAMNWPTENLGATAVTASERSMENLVIA